MYSRALHIKASKQAPFDLFFLLVGWVGREDGKRVLEMHICIKPRPLGQEVEGPSLCESHDENACAADACLPARPRLRAADSPAHPAHMTAHTAKGGEGKA